MHKDNRIKSISLYVFRCKSESDGDLFSFPRAVRSGGAPDITNLNSGEDVAQKGVIIVKFLNTCLNNCAKVCKLAINPRFKLGQWCSKC